MFANNNDYYSQICSSVYDESDALIMYCDAN